MHGAGAHRAASGENAVLYNCPRHDVILGPIGIIIANSLLGEITPRMAQSVSESPALRILIPSSRCCETIIVGASAKSLETYLEEAVDELQRLGKTPPSC